MAALYNKCLDFGTTPSDWCESKVILIHKGGNTDEFSNFRMIALGSTLGKVLNLIVARRLTQYLTQNNLIDTHVQKGFLHDISGCFEHIQVLDSCVKTAKKEHKTLHFASLDLRNAFGTLGVPLIDLSLARYGIPENIRSLVKSQLSQSRGIVCTKRWTSDPFKFSNGIPQGSTNSPILFAAAFNVLLEKVAADFQIKYGFKFGNFNICQIAYADDLCLCSRDKRGLQKMINSINSMAKDMGLEFRPDKCRTFSISSGSAKRISFTLDGILIPTLFEKELTFLGHRIFAQNSPSKTFVLIKDTIEKKLTNIDQSKIRGEFKVKILKLYLLPALKFQLTVHDISKSNLGLLDALQHRFLKKWTGLAHSATTTVLHSKHFLNIPSFSELYDEVHQLNQLNLRAKADRIVQSTLSSEDPSTPPRPNRAVLTREKAQLKAELVEKREAAQLEKVKKLVLQGHMLQMAIEEQTDLIWQSHLFNLPSGTLKFLLNAVCDTLPTRSNLFRWGKITNSNCLLCGQTETTRHILSGCRKSLVQGRYTWRHDSIVNFIAKSVDTEKYQIYADVPGFQTPAGGTIPPDLLVTSDKPDICIIERKTKEVTLYELTIPFEDRIKTSNILKETKYQTLLSDISLENSVGFSAFEVGARGWITKENKERLKDIFTFSNKETTPKRFIQEIGKLALLGSYFIFLSRNQTDWNPPPLLNSNLRSRSPDRY